MTVALYLALDTEAMADLGSEKDSIESMLAPVGQAGSGPQPQVILTVCYLDFSSCS